MSGRLARSAILTVAVIGGAAAALPAWFGRQIEARYREGIAGAPANPYYHLEIERYDRGWNSSEVLTALAITPPEGEKVAVQIRSHVEHGPWRTGLLQARITTEPVLSPEIAALLEPVFAGRPPIVSVVSVGLSGDVVGTLDSPAATAQIAGGAMNVDWKGLQSHFGVDRDGTAMRFTGSMPGLVVGSSGGPAIVSFDGFALETNGRKSAASGLWISSGSMDLARLSAMNPAGTPLNLTGFRLASSSDEKEGLVEMTALLSAAQLTAGGDVVKDLALGFSMRDLDAAAMKKFQDFMETQGSKLREPDDVQAAQLVLAQMESLGGEFLTRKPSFAVDRLDFVYQGEPFSATARVQYVGTGNVSAFNPITDLRGNASFEAPISGVLRILQSRQLDTLKQQRAGLVGDFTAEELAEMEMQAQALAEQGFSGLVAQQMLVASGGGRIKAEATLENGRILVNGKPFPPAPPASGEAVPE